MPIAIFPDAAQASRSAAENEQRAAWDQVDGHDIGLQKRQPFASLPRPALVSHVGWALALSSQLLGARVAVDRALNMPAWMYAPTPAYGRFATRVAWETCQRADWLLRIAVERHVDRRALIEAASAVCRSLLPVGPTPVRLQRLLGMLEDLDAYPDIASECPSVDDYEEKPLGLERAIYAVVRSCHDESSLRLYLDDVAYWAAYELAVRRGEVQDEDGDIDWGGERFAAAQRELADVLRKALPWRMVFSWSRRSAAEAAQEVAVIYSDEPADSTRETLPSPPSCPQPADVVVAHMVAADTGRNAGELA